MNWTPIYDAVANDLGWAPDDVAPYTGPALVTPNGPTDA